MHEICFCGWSGELEEREPVLDSRMRWTLRCPDCGHLDDLQWLDEEKALMLCDAARRRKDTVRTRQGAA